jgi:hypothetical protein
MITHTLKGTYHNGLLKLESPISFDGEVEVVVIFLEKEPKPMNTRFSFRQALALTQQAKGSLSQMILEERRAEKW